MSFSESTGLAGRHMLVDGHVHVHPTIAPATILDAAARNMIAACQSADQAAPLAGALLLTESEGVNAFGDLPSASGAWRIEATSEPISRRAIRDEDGASLLLVAGRQIVTADGLEVHALGCDRPIADGGSLSGILAEVKALGAVPVLPWGFGKWLGGRGRIIRDVIEDDAHKDVFFADCGTRPIGAAQPALLAEATKAGRILLAGTDPLPLKDDENRVGAYGFRIDFDEFDAGPNGNSAIEGREPFAALRAALSARRASPPTYGRRAPLPTFLRQQVAMQIRQRLAKRRHSNGRSR